MSFLKRVLFLFYYGLGDLSLILRFVLGKAGNLYGISWMRKLILVFKIIRNAGRISSYSSWQQHLLLTREIFSLPVSLKGDVVECGCYKGACTANLSKACAMTNRKLIVCDSFEGLPQPAENEKLARYTNMDYYTWCKGQYRGTLEEVRNNVQKYGSISACQFVQGYYKDTLKDIGTNSIVLIFEDVDLPSSVSDCLKYLWPKLQEGCRFYCHECNIIDVVSLFYDKQWWQDNLGTTPPGLFGSGLGVLAGFTYSLFGYAIKLDKSKGKELFDGESEILYR